MKAFLAESFPQIPVAAEIDDAELKRFAESEGGRFPDPQYCPGLFWLAKGGDGGEGGASIGQGGGPESSSGGVALVGDAIHAFPPDLGQVGE